MRIFSTVILATALSVGSPAFAEPEKDPVGSKEENIFDKISEGYDRAKERGQVETRETAREKPERAASDGPERELRTGDGRSVDTREMNRRERMEVRDMARDVERPMGDPRHFDGDSEADLPEKEPNDS